MCLVVLIGWARIRLTAPGDPKLNLSSDANQGNRICSWRSSSTSPINSGLSSSSSHWSVVQLAIAPLRLHRPSCSPASHPQSKRSVLSHRPLIQVLAPCPCRYPQISAPHQHLWIRNSDGDFRVKLVSSIDVVVSLVVLCVELLLC